VIDESPVFRGGARALRIALALGATGSIALVLGAFVDRRRFFFSYLTAYAFATSVAVGALIFLLICHAMRAGWPIVVRRIVEAIVSTFPLLAVLFVPLVFGLDALYPWLTPERLIDARERALVAHKRPYLNLSFFLARTALFFVIWLVVAGLLRRWSERQDVEPAVDVRGRVYRLSVGALPVVALATSFAAFDWLMSLTPTWSSSMFPVYFFAGGFVAAIALVSLSAYGAQASGHLLMISSSHYYALGRLLLAFTVFWAYAAFFQFMLIWLADRPDEATFYLARANGPWTAMTVLLVAGHFVVPFALLLNYRLKRNASFVGAMGAWILVFHYLDIHWLVVPYARPGGFPLHWLDACALLAVGGFAVAAGLHGARGRRLVPNDPRLEEALSYESP
jgi:hypothetical protein